MVRERSLYTPAAGIALPGSLQALVAQWLLAAEPLLSVQQPPHVLAQPEPLVQWPLHTPVAAHCCLLLPEGQLHVLL